MILTHEENPEEIKKYAHIQRGSMFEPHCFAKCPGRSLATCSRVRGHSGPHVVHGGFFNPYVSVVWDEDPE
jgi:hypothetical protein